MHDPTITHDVKLPAGDPTTVSMKCVPGVGMAPVRSLTPPEHVVFGLLDVVMELAGINAAAYGDFAAMAAKSLANVARLEGMPKAQAFPKDAAVIPFPATQPDPPGAG